MPVTSAPRACCNRRTAASFWGYLGPRTGPFVDDVDWPFMFTGTLSLPGAVREAVGWTKSQASIGGGLALAVMSVWTGAGRPSAGR